MCGINGILQLKNKSHPENLDKTILDMSNQVIHRGPDDYGAISLGPMHMGFRRLSIIDICGGHQPIHNENKTIWSICNGEIYNYVELRNQLESKGHEFKTLSDTESIVHAYEEYGVDFVERLNGMFSIALWDSNKKQLLLARDRLGQKPLMYSIKNNQLAFGSELKSLSQWSNSSNQINYKSIEMYLRLGYIPEPQTIFKNTFKLLPGHMLIIDSDSGKPKLTRYWNFSINPNHSRNLPEIKETLKTKIDNSVKLRLQSDVPVGTLLSGGIDSSIITASASAAVKPTQLFSFSAGFENKNYDETESARDIAEHFNTNHVQEQVPSIKPDLLTKIVWNLDEPFGDSSAVPTFLICLTAKKHVTVALSGDGGDELFGGYTRYKNIKLIGLMDFVPSEIRNQLLSLTNIFDKANLIESSHFARQLDRFRRALRTSLIEPKYRSMVSSEIFPQILLGNLLNKQTKNLIETKIEEPFLLNIQENIDEYDLVDTLLYIDTMNYLSADILTKVDRMSMANSLEVRSPFLDYELVEYASSIPNKLKILKGTQKYILKETFKDILPPNILSKPKKGFSAPIGEWLTSSLKDIALDCLSEDSTKKRGLFNHHTVNKLVDISILTKSSNPINPIVWTRLWTLIMLELWFREFDTSI